MPLFERASNFNIYGGTFNDIYGDPVTMERMKEFLDDDERQKIMAWVSPTDVSTKHFDVASRRQPGTGQWLLDSDTFQAWKRSTSQAVWCAGMPGAGKTVLASLIIDELCALRCQEPVGSVGVAWVYFNYKEESTQTPELIHRSLTRQLAEFSTELYAHLKSAYQKEHRSHPSASRLGWIPDLRILTQEFAKVFIVIDALDECAEKSQDTVLGMLADLQKAGANVLITSRDHLYESITASKLYNIQRIDICGTVDDITRYAEARLDGNRRLTKIISTQPSLRTEIVTAIANSCQGMFLMATLHIAALESQLNVGDIMAVLEALPKSFPDIYDDALNRVENSIHRLQALRVLSFLIYACRPLTVPELQHFLAVRPDDIDFHAKFITDKEMLVAICAGLVVIDKEADIIRLVHFTTQQYFDAIQTKKFPEGNLDVGRVCLTYLSFSVFKDIDGLQHGIHHYTLLNYIIRHWHVHVRDHQEALRKPLLALLEDHSLLHAYSLFKETYSPASSDVVKWHSDVGINGCTGLHVAAETSLLLGAKWLLAQGCNVNSRDSSGKTPLMYACAGGHAAMCNFLVAQGAEVNACNSSEDITALHYAVGFGSKEAVNILLKGGARVNVRTKDGITALVLASAKGNEAIVRILLDAGAAINPRGRRLRKMIERMRLGDESDWDSDSSEEDGHFKDGLFGKVLEFLGQGRMAEVPSALEVAMDCGHSAIVCLLLERGAAVDAQDGKDMLRKALEEGNEAIVRSLLKSGAAPVNGMVYGETPLFLMSMKGQESMVRLLLDSGASINAKTKWGKSALYVASSCGHQAVVRLLLERGAAANTRDSHGKTALQCALENENEIISRLLIENGASVERQDSSGKTLLYIASKQGKDAVVRLLLKCGAAVDARSKNGATALHVAVAEGHTAIVNLLLQHGADVNVRGRRGETPLHVASEEGHLDIVQLLLQKGAAVDARNKGGTTPLEKAAERHHEAVVHLLIESGADVNAAPYYKRKTAALAALREHR